MNLFSNLTFKDICDSEFGSFVKVVWNEQIVYDDTGDTLIVDGQEIPATATDTSKAFYDFIYRYWPRKVYSFYCKVVNCHHTELYIDGDPKIEYDKHAEFLDGHLPTREELEAFLENK